ncbi:hypothetical protein CLHOM_28440 [Clostridium homopropionicum DSM 5847]|uniref:Uncharacterized protein n=1 Tax=Clostridium homopropionicum DSM 5847 TaxID=1121318 RepID=A0A0L6Z754_9CLOT|nr:hypothetical protein [Clostridium homopropionicum]KOA18796.1 hypothetical protein CLHOM_28440 [Clostridium homopropionicum DSM 5847]SFG76969.1 hypothetical protein SAMN04488501_11621 [Clostridium homopropionicum]
MRKYKFFLPAILLIIMLTACTQKKAENVREKDRFDIKVANNVVEKYLKYVSEENFTEASKLLTEKLKKSTNEVKANDLKIKGFRVEEMGESGGKGNFTVRVIKINASKPETQLLDYKFKVLKDGIDYKINEIKPANNKESFRESNQLRLRKEKEVETFLITDFDGLPKYAYSKDDSANMKSQLIPKTNYGMMTLNYSGDTIALTTTGDGVFLGILSFDDTMKTQGSQGGMKGGGGAGGGAEGSDQGAGAGNAGTKGNREKPIGKEMTICDIIQNGNIENLMFSKDEKLLAAQYTKGNARCIRVYTIGSGELINVKFEEEYPLNKVDVVFDRFEKEKMIYKVVPKSDQDKNNEFVGQWEMSTKNFKIKKAE